VEKPYHESDAVFLFLAYFGILSLVPFLLMRDQRADPKKEYVYWHARQGLALMLCVIVLGFALMMVDLFLGWIPFVGWALSLVSCCVWPVYLLVVIGAHVACWIKAFGGQKWPFPGACKIAEMFG
jgi:uncharacterized membrane protein